MKHAEKVLRANLAYLKMAISEQNLELIPDYEQRISVLKELKFIDENSTVLLKGRVACEVGSCHYSIQIQPLSLHADQFDERASLDRANPRKYPSCV